MGRVRGGVGVVTARPSTQEHDRGLAAAAAFSARGFVIWRGPSYEPVKSAGHFCNILGRSLLPPPLALYERVRCAAWRRVSRCRASDAAALPTPAPVPSLPAAGADGRIIRPRGNVCHGPDALHWRGFVAPKKA